MFVKEIQCINIIVRIMYFSRCVKQLEKNLFP
jgi:hypothetical protein